MLTLNNEQTDQFLINSDLKKQLYKFELLFSINKLEQLRHIKNFIDNYFDNYSMIEMNGVYKGINECSYNLIIIDELKTKKLIICIAEFIKIKANQECCLLLWNKINSEVI